MHRKFRKIYQIAEAHQPDMKLLLLLVILYTAALGRFLRIDIPVFAQIVLQGNPFFIVLFIREIHIFISLS